MAGEAVLEVGWSHQGRQAAEGCRCVMRWQVEIRAATVQAVEMVKTELSEVHRVEGVLSLTLDWLLWQEGEKLKEEIPPHHRTLTIFY